MKILLRLALGSALAGTALTATAAQAELLVKFKPNASPVLLNAAIGARTITDLPQIGWQKVRLPATVSADRGMRYYRSLSTVAKVETSIKYQKALVPNDPEIGNVDGKQYQHQQIKMFGAWELSLGSPSVAVAVVDSGIRATHEDLVLQHLPTSKNFTNGGNEADIADPDGHGTHVAGLAAATANNGKGGAGTGFNVKVLTCRVTFGTSGTEDFAKAIMYAADQGVKVINMSFGSYGNSDLMDEAVQYAYKKDVVMVGGAGNDNRPDPFYPGSLPNVINCGSTDRGDGKSDFSNHGHTVDVAAPGGNLPSPSISGDSNYVVYSGTSMASPVTAGAVALMRAYAPELPAQAFYDALFNTARQGDAPFTLYGQIDVHSAILSLPVGVKTDENPSSAAPVPNEGTFVNGTGSPTTDSAYLTNADNSALEIRSNYRPAIGTVAAMTTEVPVTASRDKIMTGRLQMSLRAASGVSALIMLQNPTTGAWELFTSVRLSANTTNVDVPIVRPALLKFLKQNGRVSMMVRTINPSRLSPGGTAFRTSVDQVGLLVTSRK